MENELRMLFSLLNACCNSHAISSMKHLDNAYNASNKTLNV